MTGPSSFDPFGSRRGKLFKKEGDEDPLSLQALRSRYPGPTQNEVVFAFGLSCENLGNGWTSAHIEFWEEIAEASETDPSLKLGALDFLMARLALVGPRGDRTFEEYLEAIENWAQPLLTMAHGQNDPAMKEMIEGGLSMSKDGVETFGLPGKIPMDPEVQAYASALIEYFDTDRLIELERHPPFRLIFEKEVERVRVLLAGLHQGPSNSEPPPEDFDDGPAMDDGTMEDLKGFKDWPLRTQLRYLGDTTPQGSFFLMVSCVSEGFTRATVTRLMNHWLGEEAPERLAAGGLLCYLIAEDDYARDSFVSLVSELLNDCYLESIPRFARLISTAGLLMEQKGDKYFDTDEDGGGVAVIERAGGYMSSVAEVVKRLIDSKDKRDQGKGLVLLAQLTYVDEDWGAYIGEFLVPRVAHSEGVRCLTGLAKGNKMVAEALGLMGVPQMCVEHIAQAELQNSPYISDLLALVDTIVCTAHRNHDRIVAQVCYNVRGVLPEVAKRLLNSLRRGYLAARARDEHEGFQYLKGALDALSASFRSNALLFWQQNPKGLEFSANAILMLLKKVPSTSHIEPIEEELKRIRMGLDRFYDRLYLGIRRQREEDLQSEKSIKPPKEISDKEILSLMPQPVRKLFRYIDELDKLQFGGEADETTEGSEAFDRGDEPTYPVGSQIP